MDHDGDKISGVTLQFMRLRQLFQQRLRLLQIDGVKPLLEPAVDWGEEVVGLRGFALGLPEAGEAGVSDRCSRSSWGHRAGSGRPSAAG